MAQEELDLQPNQENEPAQDQPQYSDVEVKAMEMGWRPQDEWQGDEDDWIDAKNFVRNKAFFDKIDQLNRKVKDQTKAMEMLQQHHNKVEEATRKQVIAELNKAKKAALEEGDADRLIEIDDEIAKQRSIEAFEKNQVKQKNELHPNFVNWVEQNAWYTSDISLRQEADVLGLTYRQLHPDKDADEILEYVSKQIKKNNPDKFKNTRRESPSMVEGSKGQRAPSKKTDEDKYTLTEEERRVMNTFVRNKLMTEAQYISELKKVKGG